MSYSTPTLMVANPSTKGDRKGIQFDASLHFTADTQGEAEMVRSAYFKKKYFDFIPVGNYHHCRSANLDKIGGTSYMLHLSVGIGDDEDGSTTEPRTAEDFQRYLSRNMGIKDLRWDPTWWGILKADKTHAGLQAVNKHTSTKKKNLENTYYYEYLNIEAEDDSESNTPAIEGDYIYRNARPRYRIITVDKDKELGATDWEIKTTLNTAADPNGWTVGTPQTKLSPYLNIGDTPLSAEQAVEFCGHPFRVFTYSITFYTKRKFDTIDQRAFMGVNPANGFPSSPGRKMAPWDSQENVWKTIDMKFDWAFDDDSRKWTKISLVFEMAPYGFKWDFRKNVHGEWWWHVEGL